MASELKRSYYAIIPATVRYDKTLKPNAKLLYGEITALCNETGACWATNKYFADLYEVTETCVSMWIKNLINKGYITRELVFKENTKEIEVRYLKIINHPPQEILTTPPQKKLKDNITGFNNTNNKIIADIILYLNEKAHKNYPTEKPAKAYVKAIIAKLNEKRPIEEFKQIIDYKVYEWLEDEKMNKYLNPETLFRDKNFEKYLEQMKNDIGYETQEQRKARLQRLFQEA